MDAVLLVLAEHFKNVVVGHKLVRDLDGKRLGVHLGIVKGHFDIQMSEVAAAEALGDAQGFAMAMAHHVENGSVVEACCFRDQRVTHPMSGGIAVESRKIKLLGKHAAVREALAMQVAGFRSAIGPVVYISRLTHLRCILEELAWT